jgi:hypothetical protein
MAILVLHLAESLLDLPHLELEERAVALVLEGPQLCRLEIAQAVRDVLDETFDTLQLELKRTTAQDVRAGMHVHESREICHRNVGLDVQHQLEDGDQTILDPKVVNELVLDILVLQDRPQELSQLLSRCILQLVDLREIMLQFVDSHGVLLQFLPKVAQRLHLLV